MGSAELACVPSLYEGFSLPTAELMATATPLVVSRAGAIPEVVGPDGLCADLVTPGDVAELVAAVAALLDDPDAAPATARPAGAGSRSCSAGGLSRSRPPRPTRTRSPTSRGGPVLTVDFDRLGLRPGDRVLDLGCGAGRHAFEMYRRGADVVAFDQDADELARVRDVFVAMAEAGEVPPGAEADVKEGDALSLPFADGEFDRVVAAEILEHVPADIQALGELVRVLRPGRHDRPDGAALAARGHLLEALGRLPQHAGRPHPHLLRRGAGHQGRERRSGLRRPPLRPRPALAVLVDQVRSRRRQRRPPAREGLPPPAGLGHHEGAAARRGGPRRRSTR